MTYQRRPPRNFAPQGRHSRGRGVRKKRVRGRGRMGGGGVARGSEADKYPEEVMDASEAEGKGTVLAAGCCLGSSTSNNFSMAKFDAGSSPSTILQKFFRTLSGMKCILSLLSSQFLILSTSWLSRDDSRDVSTSPAITPNSLCSVLCSSSPAGRP